MKRRRPSKHYRRLRTKKGKKRVLINKHIKKRKKTPILRIPKSYRNIIQNLASNKKFNKKEAGGWVDAEYYNGQPGIEGVTVTVGTADYVDLPPLDFEIGWHLHPPTDILLPSSDDIIAITQNNIQQGEILLHKTSALLLLKTNKINAPKLIEEYKRTFNKLLKEGASDKELIKTMIPILKKHGFKVKEFKEGDILTIPLRRIY